jgi:hypothetical protein
MVREAIARYLDDETRFAEAGRLALAAAGDFVLPGQVWDDVEIALKS